MDSVLVEVLVDAAAVDAAAMDAVEVVAGVWWCMTIKALLRHVAAFQLHYNGFTSTARFLCIVT